jgi:hypothetical protein
VLTDDKLAEALAEQILSLWVLPELQRRGLPADRAQIQAALVVMHPHEGLRVLLNDEASVVFEVATTRPIRAGEAVTESDIGDVRRIRPDLITEDAAWALVVRVATALYVAFDFRRYRGTAKRLLALARQYLDTAYAAQSGGLAGPAIENAYAAAELAVKAQMLLYLAPAKLVTRHDGRRDWITQWAAFGNAPPEHSSTLAQLGRLHPPARYGDSELEITSPDLAGILEAARQMVTHAEAAADDSSGRGNST